MTRSETPNLLSTADVEAHQHFVDLIADVRPELFRYCARMTGSIWSGEDIVQETLAKAYQALGALGEPPPLRPWLFRIAHNAAMDFLKRHEHKHFDLVADVPELPHADDGGVEAELVQAELVEAALARFVELPPLQRSVLVLKDVLGDSLAETAATVGISVSAVKAALVRARANLAKGGPVPEPAGRPEVSAQARASLQRYADLFNHRDWSGLRALVGEESQLDIVTRTRRRGQAVAEYYSRYEEIAPLEQLRAEVGWVDDTPVIAMFRATGIRPAYFVRIEWHGEKVGLIRDFRYVPYIAHEACYAPA